MIDDHFLVAVFFDNSLRNGGTYFYRDADMIIMQAYNRNLNKHRLHASVFYHIRLAGRTPVCDCMWSQLYSSSSFTSTTTCDTIHTSCWHEQIVINNMLDMSLSKPTTTTTGLHMTALDFATTGSINPYKGVVLIKKLDTGPIRAFYSVIGFGRTRPAVVKQTHNNSFFCNIHSRPCEHTHMTRNFVCGPGPHNQDLSSIDSNTTKSSTYEYGDPISTKPVPIPEWAKLPGDISYAKQLTPSTVMQFSDTCKSPILVYVHNKLVIKKWASKACWSSKVGHQKVGID